MFLPALYVILIILDREFPSLFLHLPIVIGVIHLFDIVRVLRQIGLLFEYLIQGFGQVHRFFRILHRDDLSFLETVNRGYRAVSVQPFLDIKPFVPLRFVRRQLVVVILQGLVKLGYLCHGVHFAARRHFFGRVVSRLCARRRYAQTVMRGLGVRVLLLDDGKFAGTGIDLRLDLLRFQ